MSLTSCMRFTFLALALSSALPARAGEPRPNVVPASIQPTSGLAPQEREMLDLAVDFAARCGETMERWIASSEVTRERLFSFLYYPVPNTDPPKFTTDWDRSSDRDILKIEEAVLAKSPLIQFAVLVDRNGYLPTHNQRYSQPLTGNLANDLVNNRTKRIFNDRTGLAAAQSEAPFLIQRYQRDTGETMADLSVPVVVRGVRWGAVRIGYRALDAR
jgi:methyl-accepting chemotaxis protein